MKGTPSPCSSRPGCFRMRSPASLSCRRRCRSPIASPAIPIGRSSPRQPRALIACQPLLNRVADALGLGSPPVFVPSIELGVVAVVLAVVAVSAALPSVRAGRLSAARAITLGAAPSMGKRSLAGRWMSRLPLPRAISLGAAEALVRPLRGAITVAVILIGVGTLTFASGMYGTASAYVRIHPSSHIQVQVDRIGSYPDQK